MNFYKDYNILIRKMEKAKDKELQRKKNLKSISYRRLSPLLKLRYDEFYKLNN